jgi:DHA2 family multidrug resistance protein
VLEYGQREDWFDSSLITSLTVISTIGGVALLWRELTTRNPVINFRVLKHRQMWVGTLLGVVMGVGLYAMSFTLPVFLQTDLHMTAMQAGIAMLPGAIATAISMWVVGRLMNIVDARISIMLGALIFAASAWQLSTITSASGRSDFFWPLIGRGIGLGLMFVPLTTITLAELKGTELAQGAGLYNFFRQLGGSFGIAVIASLLTRYTNQTRAVLGEHVAMGDPTSMARIQMMTQAMIGHGSDPVTARHQALMLLDRQLYGQASILAYSRIYIISAFLMLALIPLLVLVRETQRPSGATEILE